MHLRFPLLIFCGIIATGAEIQQETNKVPANSASIDSMIPDSVKNKVAVIDTTADSVSVAETQEDSFQQDIDSLFEKKSYGVDTFAWTNDRINAGYVDFTTSTDTVRIILVDSVNKERFVMPFCNAVTCDFGERQWVWHYGVDIRLAKGDSVRAAFNGIVRVIQYDRHGYGNVVVIRHAHGLETIYGHLSKKLVSLNQKIQAGDVIGLGGRTGRSTGPHLHFEIRWYGEPFNPNHAIDWQNCTLKSDTLVLTKENFEYLIEQRKAKWYTVRKGDTLGHIARRVRDNSE